MRRTIYALMMTAVLLLLVTGLTAAQGYFSVVVLPDTQAYSQENPLIFDIQTDWIVRVAEDHNIRFVVHTGDVVGDTTATEGWEVAKEALGILDEAGIPTLIAMGFGDYDDVEMRNSTTFNQYFGARYNDLAWFGGALEPGKAENVYALFEVHGNEHLVLVLEPSPRDVVLEWASDVVLAHRDATVTVITSDYLAADGTRSDSGEAVWSQVVEQGNVHLVLSGADPGVSQRIDVGRNGNLVYQLSANYQAEQNGGDGYLRLIKVFDNGDVDVSTYSPYAWANKTDTANQFVLRESALARVGGNIIDSLTLQPIAGSRVTLEDGHGNVIALATTDASGRYDLVAAEGCYVLRAAIDDYHTAAQVIATSNAQCWVDGFRLVSRLGEIGPATTPFVWEFEDAAEVETLGNDNTGAVFALSQDVEGEGTYVLQVTPSGEAAETKIAAPVEGSKIATWVSGTTVVIRAYLPPENEMIPSQFFMGMADLTTDWAWVDGLFSGTEVQPGWNEIRFELPAKMRSLTARGTYMVFMSFIEKDRTPLTEPFYVDRVWIE